MSRKRDIIKIHECYSRKLLVEQLTYDGTGKDLGNGFVLTDIDTNGVTVPAIFDTQKGVAYYLNKHPQTGAALSRSIAPYIYIDAQANFKPVPNIDPKAVEAFKKAGLIQEAIESAGGGSVSINSDSYINLIIVFAHFASEQIKNNASKYIYKDTSLKEKRPLNEYYVEVLAKMLLPTASDQNLYNQVKSEGKRLSGPGKELLMAALESNQKVEPPKEKTFNNRGYGEAGFYA